MSNKKRILTKRQLDFYLLFQGRGDVPIEELYRKYYNRSPEEGGHETSTKMQSALGFPIASVNGRIRHVKKRVVPGIARRSYRVIDIK